MGPGVTFRKGYGWAPVFQIVVAGTRERGLTQSRSLVDRARIWTMRQLCDPAKFVYIMGDLYRAEAKNPQEITPHEWQTILAYMGATEEEIKNVLGADGGASPARG
jgi:hypothetical protein